MKEYSRFEHASIQMADDLKLKDELKKLADTNQIDVIIESGAFLGLGSTTMISEAFKDNKRLKNLYTIEINYRYFSQAKNNLKKYPFVKCCYGCSLDLQKALEFIENDEAINNHEAYPDIYIDTLINPKSFYSKEINGLLHSGFVKSIIKKIIVGKLETSLLAKLIEENTKATLLVVLDSAGGTGFLEFQTIQRLLKGKRYFLLLDDIHHLKHFRSYKEVKGSNEFSIIAENYQNGWMLAEHF